MNNIELGEYLHRWIFNTPKWVYLEPLEARARLRAAKIKPLKHRFGHHVTVLFPAWAVELLQHPECSKRMLTGARRHIDYRKEKQMEVRLIKRTQTERRTTDFHQTAVQPGYTRRDAQMTANFLRRIQCVNN